MLPMISLLLLACGSTEVPEAEPVEEIAEPVQAALEMPDAAPMDGEDIAGGGLKAPQEPPNPDAALAVDPADWEPISVPQGPREGGGVKWKGVKKRPEDQDWTWEKRGVTEEQLQKQIDNNGGNKPPPP